MNTERGKEKGGQRHILMYCCVQVTLCGRAWTVPKEQTKLTSTRGNAHPGWTGFQAVPVVNTLRPFIHVAKSIWCSRSGPSTSPPRHIPRRAKNVPNLGEAHPPASSQAWGRRGKNGGSPVRCAASQAGSCLSGWGNRNPPLLFQVGLITFFCQDAQPALPVIDLARGQPQYNLLHKC